MKLLVIAILLIISGAQQGQMEGPQNTLGIAGTNVTLTCSISTGNCIDIDWEKYTPDTNRRTIFIEGVILQPYQDRYSINTSCGCDLVIYDVKLTDAGLYLCRIFISGTAVETYAHLTVLETEPKCAINASLNSTVEGDGVHLTCEVTYDGTVKSFMMWKSVENAPAPVGNEKTISRSYTVVASAPEIPSFTCVTSFKVKVVADGAALNIPTIACETPARNVLYSVRNVTLSPSFSYYSPGTTITCAAKGHPSPNFKWQVRESGNERTWMDIPNQNRSEFTACYITSQRYRCIAMNVVRGKSYNATSQEFQFDKSDGLASIHTCSPADRIEVGIGIGCGIGFLAAIILASIVFAILVRSGYLEFRVRQANQPSADVTQPMKYVKSPSSNQHSSIPAREAASGGPQESAYASLGSDRDTNAYESIAQRQIAKPKKKSGP